MTSQITDIYTENDNKYVSISFTNVNNSSPDIPLEYNVTKTQPIIDRSGDYYVTVTKFDIPLQSLPIAIMPIVPNQSNSNLSTLQIGIRNAGVNYLKNIIFVPQSGSIFPVPVQNAFTQIITPYYYLYSYQHMITMINTALSGAYSDAGLAGTPPYFIFDPSTQLISLIVNSSFNSPVAPFIIMNYLLFQYIDNFYLTSISFSYTPNSLWYFNVYGLVNDSYGYTPYGAPPVGPPQFYKLTQDAPSLSLWNPIKKLLFLSSTMPITYEVVPAGTTQKDNSGVFSSLAIITEFTPQIQNADDARSIAYYNTSGYGGIRLTDMNGNNPLYKIDIKVLWQDINNNIYPMIIPNFQQANIKLGFIRKSLYKNF